MANNCTRTPYPCCGDYFTNDIVSQGQRGPIGPTGPTGPSITLTIGEVTTGAPGTQASASITGTSPNYVLNLTIPQGPTGGS